MKRQLIINFSATDNFDEVNYSLKRIVRKAAEATLDHESFPYDAEISLTFTDNKYIRKLNKRYREKDKHTDVLSVPMYDFASGEAEADEAPITLGDIVISLERAKKQAEEIGNSFITEVAFLTVHSTLHLLGYDHERGPEDDEEQCRVQREIMGELILQ